jgi:ATP-dependent Lon protease
VAIPNAAAPPGPVGQANVLLPVLPLPDVCLFPEASLNLIATTTPALRGLEMALRSGKHALAVAQKDTTGARDLHDVGTVAEVSALERMPDGTRRVEIDGLRRARVVTLLGIDTLVAEAELLDEGEAGDEWGPAVEALARYLHAHAELRAFLEQQRRSREPMAWVNLACQHLPIAASARQKLLEAVAAERCQKISRGLDALLRKEQAF